MKRKITQDAKLFSHDELTKLLKNMNSLELMDKISKTTNMSRALNQSQYKKTGRVIRKLTRK